MMTPVEASLTNLLERCYQLAHTEVSPADEEEGAIAYFPVYFPEEIVHAYGLRPHALLGGGNRTEVRLADARIGSFVCSICRSTTEQSLNGTLHRMSGFFAQPICDAAKHMAGIWGRNLREQPAQLLSLPQNANSPAAASYLYDEYQRLRSVVADWTGKDLIGDDAIRASIQTYNVNRRLQRELYRMKCDEPERLSTVEAYLLIRAGARLRKEEHNQLLQDALDLLRQRPVVPRDKPRVVFLGGFCEQPPLEMIEVIEDVCFITADDLLLGQRWITSDIPEDGPDPVWELARSYIERSGASPVQYDANKPKELMLMKMLGEAGAEAAIIAAAKFCEPGLDDQLALSHYLDARKTPYLVLEFEEKMTNFEQMSMQIETFAESLLFR
jgi:benzoyl-CoA reductase subunit C